MTDQIDANIKRFLADLHSGCADEPVTAPQTPPPMPPNVPRTPKRLPGSPMPHPTKESPRIVRFMLSSDGDRCDHCGNLLPPYFLVFARTDGHLFCSERCANDTPLTKATK